MRGLSLALLAVVFAGTLQNARAADMPVKAPLKAPPIVAPYSWTGFYVGGNVGYSWGKTESTFTAPVLAPFGLGSFSDDLHLNGVIGGGQIGYNWQVDPRWVLGIEADFQGSGEKDSSGFSAILVPPPGAANLPVSTLTLAHEEKLSWFGTVRGRVGYILWNNGMVYATGGLAYGRIKSSLTANVSSILGSTAAVFSSSDTNIGWTAGAGVEGQILDSRNWTWKVEYLYMDLGSFDHSFNDPTFGTVSVSTDFTDHIVRAGINYRF